MFLGKVWQYAGREELPNRCYENFYMLIRLKNRLACRLFYYLYQRYNKETK